MSSLASRLVPEAVKKLIPYQSARRIGGSGRIWLNANELEAPLAYDSSASGYHRYPDFMPAQIAQAYQSYAGTNKATIAVRGADEAIDLLIRTFCQPGKDKIVICSPTYAMYEFCADALAIETLDVPLNRDFSLDCEQVVKQAENANLIFLCSPNNPTGNVIAREQIVDVLEGTKQSALVVVDEAYIEFEPETSVLSLMEEYPHLVVIRTLSKAFGLAAVRCGYIVADDSVMSYVEKLIPPYPIPDSSAEIVLKALSAEGLKCVSSSTEELKQTRDWFIGQLGQFDFIQTVYPSSTNFVLLRCRENTALFEYLKEHGIITRNQHHEPALRHCARITIGTRQSMAELIEVLQQFNGQ